MRVARGLTALAALLAGLVGVPWLLVALTRQLQPVLAPWRDLPTLLTGPDPLAIMIALLLGVAWAAWVIFVLGVASEVVDLLSGRRLRLRLPGLAATQRLAAGLLVSVVAMISTTQASTAEPVPTQPVPTTAGPESSEPEPTAPRPTQSTQNVVTTPAAATMVSANARSSQEDQKTHVHVVERGDDLWSLAQRYYGHGSDWRRIAAANPERLTGGPDRLVVGWKLRIPGVDRGDAHRAESKGKPTAKETADNEEKAGLRTVVVQRDETLSGLAERLYGAEERWPVLWRANRHQLDDPDELLIGMRLVVPTLTQDRPDEEVQPEPKPLTEKRPGARSSAPARPPVVPSVPTRPTAPTPPAAPERPATEATTETTTEATTEATTESTTEANAPQAPGPEGSGAEDSSVAADASRAIATGLAAVGALLAASLIAGLAARRRLQLQARPVGRRILHPDKTARSAEQVLGPRARVLGLRTLDLATRAISAYCYTHESALPALTVATVADDHLDLHWARPVAPPPGFRADGSRWILEAADVDYLQTVPGLTEAVRPYPALVTLGLDADRQPVVGNLESLGLLRLQAEEPEMIEATLTAMAVELSFSPWAEEMILTLVGTLPNLPEALGRHNVNHTDDVDALLNRLEARAIVQRSQQTFAFPGQHRVDPDLADPWAPEIVLINQPLTDDQEVRLDRLLTTRPRVTMAAVLSAPTTARPTASNPAGGWTLRLAGTDGQQPSGVLQPIGWKLTPQLIEAPAAAAVLELISVTGSEVTTPAPWWADPDPPPDNVTYLGKRFGGWATRAGSQELAEELGEANEMGWEAGDDEEDLVLHPTLRLLGPIELVGAAGTVPPRAAKQCLEYCGWLLENPGATARAMAASLVVAEGTRRSNMSRLRTWLGENEDGSPYLPDAYSGRIVLHGAVSSDWQRLQIFTAAGVNVAGTSGLRAALQLVRGAPLADAAPGQWHWAEELRTDMISAVRDIGVELTARALDDNDIDLARWAASRALVAAPGDELLLVARIRTEHQAGNRADVERLTLQLAAQARQLGVDLAPETVRLLQEVMEGRVRARLA